MATWILGDVHGCATELHALLQRLALGPEDRLVSVGDLLHRGPDPIGVLQLLEEQRVSFVLGNHELVVLRRFGLAPRTAREGDWPGPVSGFSDLSERDLAGDGGMRCPIPAGARPRVLEFLQRHSGLWIRSGKLGRAGPTADGRPWCVVHAGIEPGRALEEQDVRTLTSLRRLERHGRPWWYELHDGPALVLFGHTPSRRPRVRTVRGRLVALGLDTGCVYGGKLTAYSPELDCFERVDAARTYAAV